MESVKDVLDKNRGLGPGFDFLRVALAIGVVAWHALPITTGSDTGDTTRVLWVPGYAILTMFFGLSGFLIAGSATRLTLRDFLINRSLRIFPALAVEILLSALVLGPLLTSMKLSSYFESRLTYHYLTNIVALINYKLPGVSDHNPVTLVNVSLWTVPFEFGCYGIISIAMLAGALRKPRTFLLFALAFLLVGLGLYYFSDLKSHRNFVSWVAGQIFWSKGSRLFAAFILGIAAYLSRAKLPYIKSMVYILPIAFLVVSFVRPSGWLSMPLLNALLLPLTVYWMVLIGATRVPSLPIYKRGDYSYGIYLYGMPIQQTVFTLIPVSRFPLGNLLISVPLITLFAMVSWHFIEKPILHLRRRFSFVARVRGVEGPGESLVGAPPPQ